MSKESSVPNTQLKTTLHPNTHIPQSSNEINLEAFTVPKPKKKYLKNQLFCLCKNYLHKIFNFFENRLFHLCQSAL